MTEILDLEALAGRVPRGALLAVSPDYAGVAMAATRALIAAGTGELHLLAVPTSGLQADLLIGAGAVARIEAAGVSLGEFGPAPRFAAAVSAGALAMADATCPAIHAGLQAAEKGVPFLPLRGVIGSDLLRVRQDWTVIDNPFAEAGQDPILLVPAIRPDVALFHAPKADRAGNVWIGRRRELATMAHAARATLATVECIVDDDLLADEASAAGVLPALYVTALAEAPRGAWPLGLAEHYPADADHLRRYASLALSADGFARYLEAEVLAHRPSAA